MNMTNIGEVSLTGKTLLLAPLIFDAAQKFQQSFCENKQYDKVNESVLLLEAIFFLLHLVDRETFDILGHEKRDIMMGTLEEELFDKVLISLSASEKKAETKRIFIAAYNARQKEYSKYVSKKNDDSGPKDELLWEFGKIVAEMIGEPKSRKIGYAVSGMALTIKYFYPDLKEYLVS